MKPGNGRREIDRKDNPLSKNNSLSLHLGNQYSNGVADKVGSAFIENPTVSIALFSSDRH